MDYKLMRPCYQLILNQVTNTHLGRVVDYALPGLLASSGTDRRILQRSLVISSICIHNYINIISRRRCNMDDCQWEKTLMGHTFTVSRASYHGEEGFKNILDVLKSWVQTHEEAQVMLASLLIVLALWWLLRALLGVLINLVLPLLFIVLAIICIPQLREPLLGQNYPLVANLLRSILLKMAENLKT